MIAWAAAAVAATLTVRDTELVLDVGDGRVLTSADLVGAKLDIGDQQVTIAAVERDPRSGVWLHRFVLADGTDLCAADADGRHLGFPIPDDAGGFDLTCTSGAIGKCVRWGYRPWEEAPGGPPHRALHEACVHLIRADYTGDGRTATRDGTRIALCDRHGVVACPVRPPFAFEAAFGRERAICVARPRIAALASVDDLAAAGVPVGSACEERAAFSDPSALLLVWSRVQ